MTPCRRATLTILAAVALAGAAVFWLQSAQNGDQLQPVHYRNTYDAPDMFMRGIYAADHTIDPPFQPIGAAIVPHHITATMTIASGIKMLTHQHFSKILLISPDHFNKCTTIACTVNGVYETLFGKIMASPDILRILTASPLVNVQPQLFNDEHGIYAVLPYIKYYFPDVTVTPLVLTENLPWEDHAQQLLDLISHAVDSDTMLIISSDFSHYLPLKESDAFDEETAKALFAKDLEGLKHLRNADQSDCPNCLWLAASLAEQRDFYNPSVVLHTNSARILGDLPAKGTTSHFSIVFYQNAVLSPLDPAFGGDLTFTRMTDSIPSLTGALQAFWNGSGSRMLNLEGPLASTCIAKSNPWIFCNQEAFWKKNTISCDHLGD
jgi:AmmeMemoRadiSam system protein B